MTKTGIFCFIGRCLTLDEHPEHKKEIIDKLTNDKIDWTTFILLSSDDFVLATLHIKFKKHNLTEYLPKELADHLLEIYELNTSRNRKILTQIEEISRILNKNEIYPIFLKGAANLLDELYFDIGERILGDIDFLVPEKDFLKAANLLKECGYSILKNTPDYIETEDLKHYPRLLHPNFDAVIEIHRVPVDKNSLNWFNSEIIDKEKKAFDTNVHYFVPSDKHKIIHNFIHSQLGDQGFLYGFVSLRNIYDLLLLSKRFPLQGAISDIKKKKKAMAYFALADSILGMNKSLYPHRNLAFRILKNKTALNLNSSFFYHTYRGLVFFSERVFTGYLGRPVKSIFYKDARKAFLGRLRSPEWIQNHRSLYTRFFNIRDKK